MRGGGGAGFGCLVRGVFVVDEGCGEHTISFFPGAEYMVVGWRCRGRGGREESGGETETEERCEGCGGMWKRGESVVGLGFMTGFGTWSLECVFNWSCLREHRNVCMCRRGFCTVWSLGSGVVKEGCFRHGMY